MCREAACGITCYSCASGAPQESRVQRVSSVVGGERRVAVPEEGNLHDGDDGEYGEMMPIMPMMAALIRR